MAKANSPDRQDQLAAIKLLGVFVAVGVVAIIGVVWLTSRVSETPATVHPSVTPVSTQQSESISTPIPPPQPAVPAPVQPLTHERLAELRQQREGLEN